MSGAISVVFLTAKHNFGVIARLRLGGPVSSYADISDFGRATHPNAVANPMYLLCSQGTQIRVRNVPQEDAGILFAIDQLENPDTVVLRPGGRHGNDVILCGMIGTVSDSGESRRLYGLALNALRKNFTKQREFLVGAEARKVWHGGTRLTIGAASLTEFDLKAD
jgi:hypothetical protein